MNNTNMKGRRRLLAALGYIPLFCFLPLCLERRDEFAQFHGRQGLVLLVAWVLTWLVFWIVGRVFRDILNHIPLIGVIFFGVGWLLEEVVGWIFYLSYLLLMLTGIVEAGMGRRWRMPVLGAYAERIRL